MSNEESVCLYCREPFAPGASRVEICITGEDAEECCYSCGVKILGETLLTGEYIFSGVREGSINKNVTMYIVSLIRRTPLPEPRLVDDATLGAAMGLARVAKTLVDGEWPGLTIQDGVVVRRDIGGV